MQKAAIVLGLCGAALAALLLILIYRPGGGHRARGPVGARQREGAPGGPSMPQNSTPGEANEGEPSQITKEQFEQLSPQEQDKIAEQFIARFWRGEWRLDEERAEQEQYLSLDVFGSPYMFTIREAEFMQLSPEDQERAMAEVVGSCQEYRAEYRELVARARGSIENNDYLRAEASLISGLERARELTADKEGLLITRLVGVACQTACLREMERLYLKTLDASKLARTRSRLEEIEAEKQEIREAALRATDAQVGG
jgi:hypothetical protein